MTGQKHARTCTHTCAARMLMYAGANSHSHTKTPGGDAVGGGDRKGDVSQNGGVGGVGESSPAEGGGVGAKMVGKKHEVHVRATEYVKDPDEVIDADLC